MVDHIVDASQPGGRVEIRTGVGRRRRWSDEKKGRIVSAILVTIGLATMRHVQFLFPQGPFA
jgi:hypothetical protein